MRGTGASSPDGGAGARRMKVWVEGLKFVGGGPGARVVEVGVDILKRVSLISLILGVVDVAEAHLRGLGWIP